MVGTMFRNLLKDERGQGMVEYALVAALVAVGAIATVTSMRTALINTFTRIQTGLGSS